MQYKVNFDSEESREAQDSSLIRSILNAVEPAEANPWMRSRQVMIHLFRKAVCRSRSNARCIFFSHQMSNLWVFFEQFAGGPAFLGSGRTGAMNGSVWESRILSWWEKQTKKFDQTHLVGCVHFWMLWRPSKYGLVECTKAMTYYWWMVTAVNLPGRFKVSKETFQMINFDQTTMRFHPLKLSSRWWFQIQDHIFQMGGKIHPPKWT